MNLFLRVVLAISLTITLTGSLAVAGGAVTEVPIGLLEPPSPGKAVVYIFDAGKAPVIPSISLFDNGECLPILLGAKEYFRYECDPGLHTFSIDALIPLTPPDNGWVHGMLEEGGIYAAQIDTFLALYELSAFTGHLDRNVGVNPEGERWTSIVRLLKAKPPKPPGEDRKGVKDVLSKIGNKELHDPNQGFETLLRLNPLPREPLTKAPVDRLPEPVPGKSLVVFFMPKRSDNKVTLHDGMQRLGPDLEGGRYYIYETAPGEKVFWVPEVKVPHITFRIVKAQLEAGRVYGVFLHTSWGNGGAKLLGLSGDPSLRLSWIKEWEAWQEIEPLWNSPGLALSQVGEIGETEAKQVEKRIKNKIKKPKRLTGVTALR